MKILIPPYVKGPKAIGHPFPLSICLQTVEFMHGSLFFYTFQDAAAGRMVRLPNGFSDVKKSMIADGFDSPKIDQAFGILGKYKGLFQMLMFQNVLISIISHWDWYIRRLSEFVVFSREHIELPRLNSRDRGALLRIDHKSVLQQLEIIEKSCDVSFDITPGQRSHFKEMTLVRNLGVHNRWEVDRHYLEKTDTGPWETNQIREFDETELNPWHGRLLRIVNNTSKHLSRRLLDAPEFVRGNE